MADDDGAQPPAAVPAAGHWLQAAAPNFRQQVFDTIVRELSKGPEGSSPHLHTAAAQFELKVLKESSSKEEYVSAISRKIGILKLQLKTAGVGDSRAAAATAATPRSVSSHPQIDMHAGVKQPMAQLQVQAGNIAGRAGVRPNAQPNHPLRQNAGGMGIQQRQPQPVMRNQQGLSVNQQQCQGYQTPGPRSPATMGGAGEVDWREDMFQKMTYLKDSYLSELVDFDRLCVVHPKTKEQLESASKEEAQRYMSMAKLKERVRNTLRFLQLQKGDLNENHKKHFNFGNLHKLVLDFLQRHREMREKSLMAARNAAAARSSSQSQSYGTPPTPAADPAAGGGGGGMVLYAGGTNSQQIQHGQPAVVQTVSSPPPAQNVKAEAPPAALQQSHGDNLQRHEQPPAVVQTVFCPLPAQNVEAGAPPAAFQQSHGYQLVVVQAEDGVAVSGSAAEIVGLTGDGGTAPSTGGTCSRQGQQEPRPADEGFPPGSTTQHVSSGTPPPAQQQNQGQAEGDEVRGGAEGPTPVTQEETTPSKLRRGTQEMRSLSPAALRSLADDMGVNLKRAFRHEPEWPWDSSVDEWERRKWSSGEGSGHYKRPRTMRYGGSVLDNEIRAASAMLVDTAIVVAGARAEDGSTEIELLYSPVSLTPGLRLAVNASEISARLLVPRDYPRSSPVVVLGNNTNDTNDATRGKKKGVPAEVDVAFRRALEDLPEPRSVEGMAMAWDACARTAVVEFAHRLGGGTFSTWYAQWEDVQHVVAVDCCREKLQ